MIPPPSCLLVAGVGAPHRGDDGFGIHVVRRLAEQPRVPGVRLREFGTRSFDLLHALLEGDDLTVLVDLVRRDGPAGTLYTLEPDLPEDVRDGSDSPPLRAARASSLPAMMGVGPGRLLVLGCEPSKPELNESRARDLSEPVARAVEPAVRRLEEIVRRWRSAVSRPRAHPIGTFTAGGSAP